MSDTTTLVPAGSSSLDQGQREAVFQEGYLALAVVEDGQQIPMEVLDDLAGGISAVSRNSPWWLGDLLAYAAEHYGDDWHALVDNVGHTLPEILDRVEIASIFQRKDRLTPTEDSPGLTWQQHRLFSKVFTDKTTRPRAKKLMKKAADSGWSDDEIRDAVRNLAVIETTATETTDPEGEAKSTIFHVAVRVPASEGPAAMVLLEGMEKGAADPLINAGIHVTEVRHRISGVVPASEPKKRGRPRKNPVPVEAEAEVTEAE